MLNPQSLAFLSLALMVMVACGGGTEPAVFTEATSIQKAQVELAEETATVEADAADASPTPSPTEDPTAAVTMTAISETPTAMPTPSQEPIAQADQDHCLRCHGDKERLIETAAPVEEKPPSESSGVG
jgi:nitrate reductase cytochrome c-type subunit